jgi:putative transposase
MRENGLKARQKRQFKRTTDSHHAFPIAPNLNDQDFLADRSNQKWNADISYVWTGEGWLYLAVILDLFARQVVAGRSATGCTRSWRSRCCARLWRSEDLVRG